MKLFLPLVLAFSVSVGQAAFAKLGTLVCSSTSINLSIDLNNGKTQFWNAKGAKIASDSVFNLGTYATKLKNGPALTYVVNFTKFGLLKATIQTASSQGYGELNHDGQFFDYETEDEVVSLQCSLK